ncbi:MAG: DUF4252 domain-containing protein [Flavobacteriaceae bacterium]
MKNLTIFSVLIVAIQLLMSCSNEASLQKYYVEKQKDNAFISIDLPSSLLLTDDNTLTDEQLKTVKSIKKINMLALQINEDNKGLYGVEKERVSQIISDDKYKTLMKFGSNKMGATLLFTGEEDAIDELIVFASDEEKGFALFRVLGDDMEPSSMIKLMDSVNQKNFDFSFLEGLETAIN